MILVSEWMFSVRPYSSVDFDGEVNPINLTSMITVGISLDVGGLGAHGWWDPLVLAYGVIKIMHTIAPQNGIKIKDPQKESMNG